nr:MAG TPA_asm: portal protein [Caudoviricetes sp.]
MFEKTKARIYGALAAQELKKLQVSGSIINYMNDKTAKWTKWTAKAAVEEGFKASVWVYSTTDRKAKAAASVPWYVYRRNSKGEWEPYTDHPLQILLDKPNPFTSRSLFIKRMILQLELAGNSLEHMVLQGGKPVELWNVGPDRIKPVKDDRDFIKSYEYRHSEREQDKIYLKPGEIIHSMYVDPSNPYWGVSPLQVAARTVDTDIEAVQWNKVALQNRAVTDGAFKIEKDITREQYLELRRQVREQHEGASNARAPWVLGSGAEWQPMSLSPVDMDFIEGRKMTREEICAVFSVPPPLVGILDKANYSNMQEARRVFWLDTIIPLLTDIRDTLNRALTPYFQTDGEEIMIDYDVSNVEALQENFKEKIETAKSLWSMGVPLNTINQRLDLGFEDMEGGDIGYLPASLLPANMAAALAAGQAAQQQQEPQAAANNQQAGQIEKKHTGPVELKAYGLNTPEARAHYWKAFERERTGFYGAFTRDAARVFAEEADRVAEAYAESGDIEAALEAVQRQPWEEIYTKNYREIVAYFGAATDRGFKSAAGPAHTKDFDPFSRLILDYIFNMTARKVTYVTDYTKLLIRGLVYTGRDRGDSIATIARDIKKSFEEFSVNRSFRIARTEVVGASNYGSFAAAQQAETQIGDLQKTWTDSADSRVRESHEEMNGEKVLLNNRFSNGLAYPGDPVGQAKEVIQCRCTLTYDPINY